MSFHAPTLRLLSTSVPVAVSGAFRLYIALLFLGAGAEARIYLAFGLLVYATYTLDRALECEEDRINRRELVGSRKKLPLLICLHTFLAGSLILAKEEMYFAPFIPGVIGYLYSKGLKLGGFHIKLKGGAGSKNIVVALTWGGTIAAIAGKWTEDTFSIFIVFAFFAVKVFINSVIYDFKDMRGDARAGIKTLPLCIGEKKTKAILQGLHLIMHLSILLAMLLQLIRFEPIILLYSLFAGGICTSFYARFLKGRKIKKYFLELLVDGESTIAVGLRTLIRHSTL
ncbi:UbiA family prenyltransferase [Candidatus Pyrohabitans sp.]